MIKIPSLWWRRSNPIPFFDMVESLVFHGQISQIPIRWATFCYPMIWSQAVVCNAPIWDAAKLLPKVGISLDQNSGFLTLSVEINVDG